MNYMDIALLIILIYTALTGFRIGLVQSLIQLIGWAMAFILAINFYPLVQQYLVWISEQIWVQQAVAFALVIFIVLIVATFIHHMLQSIIKQLKLSLLNRLVGGVFGIFKSGMMIAILIHITAPFLSQTQMWQQSHIVQLILPYSPVAMQWSKQLTEQLMHDVPNKIKQHVDEIPKKQDVNNPFSP